MGTFKEETKKKTRDLHIRMTEQDMDTVKRNCEESGYRSLTRYVTHCLIRKRQKARPAYVDAASDDLGWLKAEMDTLVRQVKGVAANYNQTVALFNTLVRNVEERKVQAYIIRRAARLDTLSREMVSALGNIKELVGSLLPQEGDKSHD